MAADRAFVQRTLPPREIDRIVYPKRAEIPDAEGRPSRTWGWLRSSPKRTTGPPLCPGMIVVEGLVHHRSADLEHQMRASWRPAHLLIGAHPAVQQPLHGTLRRRRRDWLIAVPCLRVVDDQVGLPGNVGLKITQHTGQLGRRRRGG